MLRSVTMIALALGFAAPVSAAEPAVSATGVFEGRQFEYTSRLTNGEVIHIEGQFANDGDRFRFVVQRNGRVAGTVGARQVSYRVPRSERNRLASTIKASAEPSLAMAATAN